MHKMPGGLLLLLLALVFAAAGCNNEPTPTPTATPREPTRTSVPRALVTVLTTPVPTIKPGTATPTELPALPSPTDMPPVEAQPYPVETGPAFTVEPSPTETVQPGPVPAETAVPTSVPTRAHPVYGGPPLDPSEVGIQIHLHSEDLDAVMDHLRALRVGWVKVQISWKLFEPEQGRYDEFLLGEVDNLVARAASANIYVLLSVAKAPDWTRTTTEMDGPPSDYTAFTHFMAFLAGRYRGQVAAYELWNEANLRREWNGEPLSAANCVVLIRAGAQGVSSADPMAIIVSGAPAPTGINDGVDAIDDRQFLRQMLAAGLADVVDAIGAHPYGWANPPDSTFASPDPAAPTHNNHPSFFFWDTLWDYYTILTEANHPEKQVWATEFGWGSFENLGDKPPAGAEFMSAVSEWQQAAYTLRAYELAHQWRWVGPLFLWNLNFAPLLGNDFPESGYSLLGRDGEPRPVYSALETMIK